MTVPEKPSRLARLRPPFQWGALLALSALFVAILEGLGLPAALLVGPMLAGIACGVNGASVRVAPAIFVAAQGVIGCLIAASIAPEVLGGLLSRWPLVLGVVVGTLSASSLLGAMISRWGSLPGTTAVWGSAPGAASAMVLMADAFGADARLVAFMQYLRVIIVSLSAAVIARLWVDTSGMEAAPIVWFPPLLWPGFPAAVAVALVGAFGGRMTGIAGATFLGPMILGGLMHLGAGIDLQLPEWLLAVSYAMIGWTIGLKFTRPVLMHAARALPQIVASILALIAFCAGVGAIIAPIFEVDRLSAFLATSPGGMDSVAIIAAATDGVDISFIMSLQLARFLVVLLAGPALARLIATRMNR
ncbi:AbrB family transcriptional regulator [Mesorhizobium xinjiangense]|uniref:AbrB family transcriptional regulator n=1 Tax=Mesorhizobium xinjiangense TaxID=2678685 RepID=UPI0018DE4F08|nr:AbrB family transcriptional regulator [Mesorhizobium xinjiangense]